MFVLTHLKTYLITSSSKYNVSINTIEEDPKFYYKYYRYRINIRHGNLTVSMDYNNVDKKYKVFVDKIVYNKDLSRTKIESYTGYIFHDSGNYK